VQLSAATASEALLGCACRVDGSVHVPNTDHGEKDEGTGRLIGYKLNGQHFGDTSGACQLHV